MKIGPYRFDRMELAGSLGDLGTLVPLAVGLIAINGLSFSTVTLLAGLFYIGTGIYYKLPIPAQPLKVVSAIAIAFPDKITLETMAAAGIIFGATLLALSFSGIIDLVAKLFSKPVVRGIQLGLGFILFLKGFSLMTEHDLFIHKSGEVLSLGPVPLNAILGAVGVVTVLFLLHSRRFPAALVIVIGGITLGLGLGSMEGVAWSAGPTEIRLYTPALGDYLDALVLLVIPQIPLTLGNAVIGTTDAAKTFFGEGEATRRVSNRSLGISMGIANMVVGPFAGMPMCHGAGGLAAHYRFGARTGGSNIMIGVVFVMIALLLGKTGLSLLTSIPNAVLGVLLVFAGLELAMLVKDLEEKSDYFVAFLIAGIALATTNMSIAFGAGIAVHYIMRRGKVKI